MEEERIRVPAPAGSSTQQEIVRMVFTSMARRRLLPKKYWSLSRLLHDTVAPMIKVHLVADSTNSVILHRLLEGTSRRRIRRLTLDGDFTSTQQRPLSLPPSLVRLELNGFRARWPVQLERLVYWAIGVSGDAPEPCIDRPLPPKLTELELNGCSIATHLPRMLQKLKLGRSFSQELCLTGSLIATVNSSKYSYD
ncbi:hypothetical protein JKP88DRAFT_353900 [Tribonema minus]|uniref:Uncharacterized protein n=1 Tax=Tribonema minus TaxID=303371 RepID=A0A835Z5Y5_9STRA|nr:hypothetical protein JKP88DRAFT_353900 [Tribonema minus]